MKRFKPKCQTFMCVLYSLCYIVLCSLCCTVGVTGSTSLMKRIREKQSADDAMIRSLDVSSERWSQVPTALQDILMSIDDKLRSLDTFSYTLKLARLDFSLEQLVRRMENIETKLGRLETKFDVRMEKVEEVVVGKDIKEELSNEHLSRRMENLIEKINTKAAFLDAKIDIKTDRITNKLELLDRDLQNSVEDILEKLIRNDERHAAFESEIMNKVKIFEEFINNVNELKLFLKEELVNIIERKTNNIGSKVEDVWEYSQREANQSEKIFNALQHNALVEKEQIRTDFQKINEKIVDLSTACNSDRLRSLTEICEHEKTNEHTEEQLNNLTATLQQALNIGEAKFKELDSDVELYTKKVINGIQELWKTSDELKLHLSNTFEQGNKTREMVRQEFRRLHEQIEQLPKLEPKLLHISENLDKKVMELSDTVDNRFATLLVAQNAFIASCNRIQEEETQTYQVLQQIVYEMRNRSISDIHRISSELQTQGTQINNSLANVLTAMFMVGNTTTNVMQNYNSLLDQLQNQKDKCVLVMDDVNWKVIDSLCHQTTLDLPVLVNDEAANMVDEKYSNEPERNDKTLIPLPLYSSPQTNTEEDQTLIMDNNTEQLARSGVDNSTQFPGDDDQEYHLVDGEYSELLND